MKYSISTENSSENNRLTKAREMLTKIKKLSEEYKLPIFAVTDGASITINNGCEAVAHARKSHEEWEKKHGFDPNEDWSK